MKRIGIILISVVVAVAAAYVLQNTWLSGAGAGAGSTSSNLPDAPSVTIPTLEGKTVNLADYRGKVVLVNFWGTFCAPCRIEMPWFIEFQRKYGERGFTILGVAMDVEGAAIVRPWIEKERFDVNGEPAAVNYPILIGNDAIADRFGGLIGYPTTLVITRDGKIAKRFIGLVSHDKIVEEIEKQLAVPAPATTD